MGRRVGSSSLGSKITHGLKTVERAVNTAMGLRSLYQAGRALYTAARPVAAAASMIL
jgi:hypothetical protein